MSRETRNRRASLPVNRQVVSGNSQPGARSSTRFPLTSATTVEMHAGVKRGKRTRQMSKAARGGDGKRSLWAASPYMTDPVMHDQRWTAQQGVTVQQGGVSA